MINKKKIFFLLRDCTRARVESQPIQLKPENGYYRQTLICSRPSYHPIFEFLHAHLRDRPLILRNVETRFSLAMYAFRFHSTLHHPMSLSFCIYVYVYMYMFCIVIQLKSSVEKIQPQRIDVKKKEQKIIKNE